LKCIGSWYLKTQLVLQDICYEMMIGMQWSPIPAGIRRLNSTDSMSKAVRMRRHMIFFQLIKVTYGVAFIKPSVCASVSNKMLGTSNHILTAISQTRSINSRYPESQHSGLKHDKYLQARKG